MTATEAPSTFLSFPLPALDQSPILTRTPIRSSFISQFLSASPPHPPPHLPSHLVSHHPHLSHTHTHSAASHVAMLPDAVEGEKRQEYHIPPKFEITRIIDDFVFMCFFVGNDFLPCIPHLVRLTERLSEINDCQYGYQCWQSYCAIVLLLCVFYSHWFSDAVKCSTVQ